MKIIACSLFSLFVTVTAIAQDTSQRKTNNDSYEKTSVNIDEVVFTKTEKEAEFTGGDSAWKVYLQRNLKISSSMMRKVPDGTYTVIVKFIVNRDGTIRDAEAETDFGYGLEEEAIRVIKKSPKWTPAVQNGRAVNAYRRQPVTFAFATQ